MEMEALQELLIKVEHEEERIAAEAVEVEDQKAGVEVKIAMGITPWIKNNTIII